MRPLERVREEGDEDALDDKDEKASEMWPPSPLMPAFGQILQQVEEEESAREVGKDEEKGERTRSRLPLRAVRGSTRRPSYPGTALRRGCRPSSHGVAVRSSWEAGGTSGRLGARRHKRGSGGSDSCGRSSCGAPS